MATNNTSTTATPIKGMNSDLHQLNTDTSVYSFALNGITEGFWEGNSNFLGNEPSNICNVKFPDDYQVVGFVEIHEQNRVIYILTNPKNGHSQIGEVINVKYKDRTDIIDTTSCVECEHTGHELTPLELQKEQCYNMYKIIAPFYNTAGVDCSGISVNYPIDIEYKITNCSLNIYFTDALNERRFMYFDYVNNDLTQELVLQNQFKFQTGVTGDCNDPVYINEIDCSKIKVHPDYEHPCINFVDFINGGNLKAGTYQVLVAYSDIYGNPISNYFAASPIMPLFEKQITFETNYETSKALKFSLTNLKTSSIFQYYNVVIAQTIEQFTQFILAGTFSTTQNEYVYTGFEKTLKQLSPTEIFFRRPFYKTARGVTTANNYLFYTGVKEYNLLNLQPVANKIKLKWETVALKEGAYRDPRNSFYFRTYQRDEIYPFGVIFEFTNGRETCSFHIPGREATETDLEVVETDDLVTDITCDEESRNKRWQIYNTGSVTDTPHEYNEFCETDKCWERGEFAYWESTETYPNVKEVWGEDLCGKPIRHHKFPDSAVTHIHDGLAGSNGFKDNNYIFPIGVYIDHQSVIDALDQAIIDGIISAEDRASIKSYRIVRGNRVGNKSIDAKGLLFNMFKYTKFEQDYYFPNYAYNDLSDDDFLDDVSLEATDEKSKRFTFHSPDTHFTNTGLGNILKLETEEYGKSEGYFTHSECEAKQKFLSQFANFIAFGLGIAAAISATGEKQCRVITYQGPDKVEAYTVDSDGSAPYGNVHGVLTLGSGTISTSSASASWDAHAHVPEVTVNHNNADGTKNPVDGTTQGQGTDPYTGEPVNIANYEKQEITYCKGQGFQVFIDPDSVDNVTLKAIIKWIDTATGGASKIIQRTMLGILEMNKILDTLKELIPYKNYGIQYNSVGKYNNYYVVPASGDKIRKLDKTAYLDSYIQNIDEPSNTVGTFDSIKINNWNRESSVYLKVANSIANPYLSPNPDNSKCSMRNSPFDEIGDLDKRFNRDIVSYYCSVKRQVLNQYGQICNIEYLETNACSFDLSNVDYTTCDTKVFGGDTFINRFGLKRKMPFFLHTMCKLPQGSDVRYEDLFNAGSPKYFYNTQELLLDRFAPIVDTGSGLLNALLAIPSIPLNILTSIFDTGHLSLTNPTKHTFDVHQPNIFYQNGYIDLFNYGIPYFLVESDINVDYRYGQNNTDKDFYPHNTDLKKWFEEEYVPITTNNYYFYNRSYSKQNKESVICTSCILNITDLTCQTENYNRLIYSEPMDTENHNDNWLVFKANNFYDFPLTLGKLITADGIESDKVLVRLEKGTQIFNAYNTIQATGENIQVGTGGIFQSRPKDIAITDLGYAGTQHRDILHTEFGHIWANAQDGQIFNLGVGGSGMDELAKEGMKSWFKENLPFRLKEDFPQISNQDLDNNLNGIGLHYCFDKRFNRILITKLDYKRIDPKIQYNTSSKTFYYTNDDVDIPVDLWNPKYFCNKSWTISYNFYNKTWTSFHSYTPNFYVENLDTFESSHNSITTKIVGEDRVVVNLQKVYTHNLTNKSYQVFYGKIYPFIIEFQSKQMLTNNYLNSIEFNLDVIRYHNEFDTFYNQLKTFNKAIVYNNTQTSGLLNLKVSNPEDLTEIEYPKRVSDGYEILVSNSENMWGFNDFWDVTRNQFTNVPIFNYNCNNVDKVLNLKALNYDKNDFDRAGIRSKMSRVRLINDKESNYKFIFNFGQINQKQSIR